MRPGLNREIRVRRMTADDIGQVLEVERACFSEPWSADAFSATLLLPYAHYYVAAFGTSSGKARSRMWRFSRNAGDTELPHRCWGYCWRSRCRRG